MTKTVDYMKSSNGLLQMDDDVVTSRCVRHSQDDRLTSGVVGYVAGGLFGIGKR